MGWYIKTKSNIGLRILILKNEHHEFAATQFHQNHLFRCVNHIDFHDYLFRTIENGTARQTTKQYIDYGKFNGSVLVADEGKDL